MKLIAERKVVSATKNKSWQSSFSRFYRDLIISKIEYFSFPVSKTKTPCIEGSGDVPGYRTQLQIAITVHNASIKTKSYCVCKRAHFTVNNLCIATNTEASIVLLYQHAGVRKEQCIISR